MANRGKMRQIEDVKSSKIVVEIGVFYYSWFCLVMLNPKSLVGTPSGSIGLKVMLYAISLNPFVSFVQKDMFPDEEPEVVFYRFWQSIFLEGCVSHPYIDRRVIIRNAVLHKEKIHIAFEVHKQIIKGFIAFDYL